MSIPKEKTILFKIKEIVDRTIDNTLRVGQINNLVRDYEDPGYIGGPKRVWKYTFPKDLPVYEVYEIEMPERAEVIALQIQPDDLGVDQTVIWVHVDPLTKLKKRKFWFSTTGYDLPKMELRYIGTLQFNRGAFVVHLFELPN